jgi:hypothetical protein
MNLRLCFSPAWCVVLAAGLAAGCADNPKPGEDQSGVAAQMPSPEEARQALIAMGKQHGKAIFMGHFLPLDDLETAKIDREDADTIRIGRWTCNLKEGTFDAVVVFPNAPHHAYNEWHGSFQRSPEGKWQATVSDGKSAGAK